MDDLLLQTLTRDRTAVEARLTTALPVDRCTDRLIDACRHAVLGGGKRLRAALVMESARVHNAPSAPALDAAAAVEALHAYSLVHDDLPDMDDDDLRRGKPTVHVAYDPATAILVGDGLQALAFDLISGMDAPADRVVRLTRGLARAAGLWGMVGGQMRDMDAETRTDAPDDPIADVALIQSMKTGALIEWSAMAGAVLAGADPAPLQRYAQALGLAFQLRDDLLDVEGDVAQTGKAVGKDSAAGKATYVELLGVDGTRAKSLELRDAAIAALAPYGKDGQTLALIADYAVTRTY